jgi:hypothetical protein
MAICFNRAEYVTRCEEIATEPEVFIPKNAGMAVSTYDVQGRIHCIICFDKAAADEDGREASDIAAMLVHEAVHIAQRYWAYIGEEYPSKEHMAYVIQHISAELFNEYKRKIKG